MKHLKFCLLALMIGGMASCTEVTDELQAVELTCEYLKSPLGIDIDEPRLGWQMVATDPADINQLQKAYQILVASSPEILAGGDGDIWNSGKVRSSQSSQVLYKGKPLKGMAPYFWKVRLWNNHGQATQWSEPQMWSMGVLDSTQWQAKWIGDKPDTAQMEYSNFLKNFDHSDGKSFKNTPPDPLPSPMIRKSFTIREGVKDAYLYASALGYYQMALNGQRIGNHQLAPEWTDYDKRVQYQTFDLTGQLNVGENALSALLADGWYLGMLGPIKWHWEYPRRGVYGNDRRLIAQLVVRYDDGTCETIATDGSWKINPDGAVRAADNFLGETIDARKMIPGWENAGFDDSSWANVYVDNNIHKNLEAQKNEPIRVFDQMSPVSIADRGKGKYIVNFGQNLAGWCAMKIKGRPGTVVTLRHGEMLDEAGELYTANLAAAIQVDRFVLSGGNDYFEPNFTYHGFQFVEITGMDSAPTKDMITAKAVSSDPEVVGTFECSNPKVNQLFSNILWTQRDNMHSIPTDCPQRDERMGWMGDAQVFCQNSIFNMDMAAFYTKFIKDIRDATSDRGAFPDIVPHPNYPNLRFTGAPAWADAGVIIPWRLYENYADIRILTEHYAAMKKYVDNIHTKNPELLWVNDVGHMYGDWLNANTIASPPDDYSNKRGQVPNDVFATAFFANSARLLSKMAGILGNKSDQASYGKLADDIKAKFNSEYVGQDATIKGNTQSAYAIALDFDLLPDDKRAAAFSHMIACLEEYDYRMSTGFISTVMMMKELTRGGRSDIAYRLLESERFPSWLYSIDQGATSIWERWDGYVRGRGFQDPGMNSFAHYSLGSVGEWMYRVILGINPDENYPGYERFTIHPQPGGTLTWAKGSYKSIKGEIASQWQIENGVFALTVKVPANTTATVILPTGNADDICVNNRIVQDFDFVPLASGKEISVEVGSGEYKFVVNTI